MDLDPVPSWGAPMLQEHAEAIASALDAAALSKRRSIVVVASKTTKRFTFDLLGEKLSPTYTTDRVGVMSWKELTQRAHWKKLYLPFPGPQPWLFIVHGEEWALLSARVLAGMSTCDAAPGPPDSQPKGGQPCPT